jgi:hypothetical protein
MEFSYSFCKRQICAADGIITQYHVTSWFVILPSQLSVCGIIMHRHGIYAHKKKEKKTTLEIWLNLNVYIWVNNTHAISNNISFNTILWIFMTLHCDIWTLSVVIKQKNNYSYCTSSVKFIKVQTQLLRSRYTCNVNSELRWNWTI